MIERIINNPISSNCFILYDKNLNGIVIDPGSKDTSAIINAINNLKIVPLAVFLTHEHFDHTWSVETLRERYNCVVIATLEAANRLAIPKNYFNMLYYNDPTYFSFKDVDIVINEDTMLSIANWSVHCFPTPGHTQGSMVVSIDDMLFSGDTLILGKKPVLKKKDGANIESFLKSIEFLQRNFNPTTKVYPGHGEMFLLKDYVLSKD